MIIKGFQIDENYVLDSDPEKCTVFTIGDLISEIKRNTRCLVSVAMVYEPTRGDALCTPNIELVQTILEVEDNEDFMKQYQDWYDKTIGDSSKFQAIKVLATKIEK